MFEVLVLQKLQTMIYCEVVVMLSYKNVMRQNALNPWEISAGFEELVKPENYDPQTQCHDNLRWHPLSETLQCHHICHLLVVVCLINSVRPIEEFAGVFLFLFFF